MAKAVGVAGALVRELDVVAGSWILPSSAPNIADIWLVNMHVGSLSLSLSSSHSAFK